MPSKSLNFDIVSPARGKVAVLKQAADKGIVGLGLILSAIKRYIIRTLGQGTEKINMFNGIKAYLFDFDGTLIDTMGGFADIAGRVINRFHPEIDFQKARRMYLETSGIPFFQQLEIICPKDPANAKKSAIFEEEKKEGFFKERFSDDVRHTIGTLRKRGFLVGVSSNNFQELVEQFVAKEDIVFDAILGFKEGFEKGKDHFDHFMKKYGIGRDGIVFIGDSLKDAERALKNGIPFVGFCGTFKSDDFKKLDSRIHTMNNLTEILDL